MHTTMPTAESVTAKLIERQIGIDDDDAWLMSAVELAPRVFSFRGIQM